MIAENLDRYKSKIPQNVCLVAVSKTKPVSDVLEAYQAGQRDFGENKVQELIEKYEALPKDVRWHFIGHLQTNKVKYIVPFVELIHGVDSLKLLKEINKEALKHNRIMNCLLQFHIAEEDTKFGLDENEAIEFLRSEACTSFEHINICGVMGMATFTDDESRVRKEFAHLKKIFDRLKTDFFADKPKFKEISMGMSDDFEIAVEEGSTMLRIGSAIFGNRNYSPQH